MKKLFDLRILLMAIVAMVAATVNAGNPAENFGVGLDNLSADMAKATTMSQVQSVAQRAGNYLMAAGMKDSDVTYELTPADKKIVEKSMSNCFTQISKAVERIQGTTSDEALLHSVAHSAIEKSATLQDVIVNFANGMVTALTGRKSF